MKICIFLLRLLCLVTIGLGVYIWFLDGPAIAKIAGSSLGVFGGIGYFIAVGDLFEDE